MYRFRDKILPVFFILISHLAFGQTSTTSNPESGRENDPYSKYGIGNLSDGNSTVLKGMGDITSAFENPYEVNTDNPASYGFLQRTTYDAGFVGSERTVVSAGSTGYSTGTATFGYMSIGLPFNSHKFAVCIGLKPISRTYYALVDTTYTSLGQTQRAYNGDGSLNYAFIGVAYHHKGLGIGCNVGYMFGTLVDNTSVVSIDTNAVYRSYIANFPYYTRIGGIYWKAGAIYEHKLNDSDYVLSIGGTFTMKQSLTEKFYAYQISNYNFGDTIVNDTSNTSALQKGKLTLPTSFSLGIMLKKTNKWAAGVDFNMTNWNTYKSTPDTTMNYGIASTAYRISLGGEYTPNADDMRNYFQRATYRLGIYYGKDYLLINGVQPNYYGLTIGGSFPLKKSARNLSHFHAALEVGRLGTTASGLLQETYVKFSLGMSFTDIWFIPRKYD